MNKQSSFCDLIERLNAQLIIVIENDFKPLEDLQAILSKLIYLNSEDINNLLYEIRLNNDHFTGLINSFIKELSSVVSHDVHLNKLIGTGRVITALEILKDKNLEYDKLEIKGKEILEHLERAANSNESFYAILLKYGIARYPESYNPFFNELNNFIPRKSLRLFTSATPSEWDEINNEVIKNTSSDEFCLFIVDKKLGEDNDEGERFINQNIIDLKNRSDTNVISVLYTSIPKEKPLHNLNDYYTIEVYKKDPSSLEQITIGLGTCTYVHIFDRLKKIHSMAIDEAFQLALNRAENMKYLASMANEEGITPFEAVNRWFDIARKDSVAKGLLKKSSNLTQYHYILGLTQILSEEFFKTKIDNWDFETESKIQRLNTSEIYDYTVNQLHLPPAPGDIFEKNGEYYILMGQDCDFSVRKDKMERNAKMGELLKCSFDYKLLNEKITIGKDKIGINYFRNSNDEIGSLQVRFGKHVNADFNILDLCTFKADGNCSLNLTETLNNSIQKLLPEAWKLNYSKLQEFFNSLVQINNILTVQSKTVSSLSTYDLSVLNFTTNQNEINYSLKRVCRLKDEFRDVIIKNYWDHRGRIGVNTIAITDTETLYFSSLECGFLGQEKELIDINYNVMIQRSFNRERNKSLSNLPVIINLQDLKTKIPDLSVVEYNEIIIENSGITDNKSKISFKKCLDDNGLLKGISITYPYKILPSGRLLHSKENITLLEFIPEHNQLRDISKNSKIIFLDNQEEIYLFDDNGKPKKFSFSEISRGIYVPDFEVSVLLKENTISVEPRLYKFQVASTIE